MGVRYNQIFTRVNFFYNEIVSFKIDPAVKHGVMKLTNTQKDSKQLLKMQMEH